jgi:hypothetical protein
MVRGQAREFRRSDLSLERWKQPVLGPIGTADRMTPPEDLSDRVVVPKAGGSLDLVGETLDHLVG